MLPRMWRQIHGNEESCKEIVGKEIRKEIREEVTRKEGATRKYDPAAGKSVEREMKAMQEGKLKSGQAVKRVTNPKQAIAIGFRRHGRRVIRCLRLRNKRGSMTRHAIACLRRRAIFCLK